MSGRSGPRAEVCVVRRGYGGDEGEKGGGEESKATKGR